MNSELSQVPGRIHSVESGGMVDGPGIRFVAFLQGCYLRCQFCHNPDTWQFAGGQAISAGELVEKAWSYRSWMEASGGGLTLSGGDPIAQPEFTEAVLKLSRIKGMHTAIDTAGFGKAETNRRVFDAADLVILDIKSADPQRYREITGVDISSQLDSLQYLKESKHPLWLRHVVVPGLSDRDDDLKLLLELVGNIPSLERFEFLPFHKMGEEKWNHVDTEYRLSETPGASQQRIAELSDWFRNEGLPVR